MKMLFALLVAFTMVACNVVEEQKFEVGLRDAVVEEVIPIQLEEDGQILTNGYLEGIDNGVPFTGEATRFRLHDNPYATSVDILFETDSRSIMGRVSIGGDLSNFANSIDPNSMIESGRHCAGARTNEWDYDRTVEQVIINREQILDGVRIHFELVFYNEEISTTGFFDLIEAE